MKVVDTAEAVQKNRQHKECLFWFLVHLAAAVNSMHCILVCFMTTYPFV